MSEGNGSFHADGMTVNEEKARESIRMKIKKAAAVPLILQDPFFSIWSDADLLYEKDTVHWCGQRQQLRGYIKVDDAVYCFLGDKRIHEAISQKWVDVTATATEYGFENEKIKLKVRFTSPLLPDSLEILSRPCAYVDFLTEKKEACRAEICFSVSSDLVSRRRERMSGGSCQRPGKAGAPAFRYAYMGRALQQPLSGSGDRVTADWGYVYLASAGEDAEPAFSREEGELTCRMPVPEEGGQCGLVLAVDDLVSVNYFGEWRKGAWTRCYGTILDAVEAALSDREAVLARAKALDREIYDGACALGGEDYARLCCFSYRQAVAAHKLILDEKGELIFLSKENDSNGCIGTVDVSYPSVPLFLLYNPELVKGMLRPVFRFASCDVWEYDYAPHDVGRYPYAWGQVYALLEGKQGVGYEPWQEDVCPPLYTYPAGCGLYNPASQMPVEECGNMLIMTEAVCMAEGSGDFAEPWMDILEKWVQYLLRYGSDPGEQLCTDDFAGHLAHNTNLSVKAVMGIEAFARLLERQGRREEAAQYHDQAGEMARDWCRRADAGDHYMLAFGSPDTWSLKYNLVWDRLFGSRLFGEEVYEKELAWYEKQTAAYGIPLDSRASYTKSDWILWCAAMGEDAERLRRMVKPVADYLENSPSRVAFSDWYDTVTGEYCHFIARSVQGGIFMPLLLERICRDGA